MTTKIQSLIEETIAASVALRETGTLSLEALGARTRVAMRAYEAHRRFLADNEMEDDELSDVLATTLDDVLHALTVRTRLLTETAEEARGTLNGV